MVISSMKYEHLFEPTPLLTHAISVVCTHSFPAYFQPSCNQLLPETSQNIGGIPPRANPRRRFGFSLRRTDARLVESKPGVLRKDRGYTFVFIECYPLAGYTLNQGRTGSREDEADEAVSSFRASWPQAAITSRPREWRTKVGMPCSIRCFWKMSMTSGEDSWKGSEPGFHGMRFTLQALSEARSVTTRLASARESLTPPSMTYSNMRYSQERSGYSRQAFISA